MRRCTAIILVVAIAGFVAAPAPDASAADPAAEADLVARINGLRAANGIPALEVHSLLAAKAQAWAGQMAATGCVCHSNLAEGVTVGWRKLGENVGRGQNVAAIHGAFVNSAAHLANMLDRQFHWVGVGVAYGGGSMYVAEVFMDGDPPPVSLDTLLAHETLGNSMAARPQGGFWVLEGNGVVHAYDGAPDLGHPLFGGNLARDIATMPDGNGYVVLDGWGGLHKFGSAAAGPMASLGGPYWPGWDIARSLAITPDGRGLLVLDGWGGLHRAGSAGSATPGGPYWRGWDIARSIAITPDGSGVYLLDGFGGVWTIGTARHYGVAYFGWDIARDLAVWPDGRGYAVLDGFGAVHDFGTAKTAGPTAYQTIDRWRGIAVSVGDYLVIRDDGMAQRA